jgi:hypothetical protein
MIFDLYICLVVAEQMSGVLSRPTGLIRLSQASQRIVVRFSLIKCVWFLKCCLLDVDIVLIVEVVHPLFDIVKVVVVKDVYVDAGVGWQLEWWCGRACRPNSML